MDNVQIYRSDNLTHCIYKVLEDSMRPLTMPEALFYLQGKSSQADSDIWKETQSANLFTSSLLIHGVYKYPVLEFNGREKPNSRIDLILHDGSQEAYRIIPEIRFWYNPADMAISEVYREFDQDVFDILVKTSLGSTNNPNIRLKPDHWMSNDGNIYALASKSTKEIPYEEFYRSLKNVTTNRWLSSVFGIPFLEQQNPDNYDFDTEFRKWLSPVVAKLNSQPALEEHVGEMFLDPNVRKMARRDLPLATYIGLWTAEHEGGSGTPVRILEVISEQYPIENGQPANSDVILLAVPKED